MSLCKSRFALAPAARAVAFALACGCALAARAGEDAPSPAPSKLTADQLTRMELVVVREGSSVPVPPPITQALRLTPAQVAPVIRQVTIQDGDGVKHGFAFLNDHTGYFLFRRNGDQDLAVYRVDLSFHLVGAAHNFQGSRFIELPERQAGEGLSGEILAWNRVLTPRSTGPTGAAAPGAKGAAGTAPASGAAGSASAPAQPAGKKQ